MTVSEPAPPVSPATTRVRRRSIVANILVAIALLVLLAMAVADAYLLTQWNVVARMFMLGVLAFVGWLPLALAITAVCLRPYWMTFAALGMVGAAFVATFVIVWMVPDAAYPYPEISWPRRG